MKNGDVVKTTGKELEVHDFGDDAGAGLEGVGLHEQLTPILRMLQSNSPQLIDGDPKFVPGSRPGMIYNIATQGLYPGRDGIDMIICARDYHYGAWRPREEGSGFRGMHAADEPMVQSLLAKHGRFKALPFQSEEGETLHLIETGQLMVIYGPPGDLNIDTAQRAIIAFTKTSMPVYQNYISRHMNWKWRQKDGSMRPAALWSYVWRLSTRSEENAKGKYFVWSLNLAPPATDYREALLRPDDPLYLAGREFYQLYQQGKVKADYTAGAEDPDAPF